MITDANKLMELSDSEFEDELTAVFGFGSGDWVAFLQPAVIERSEDCLNMILESVDDQIATYGEKPREEGDDWLLRIQRFRRLADARRRQVRRVLYRRDKKWHSRENAWKRFAHSLAAALDASDCDTVLDTLEFPFAKDMTAGEWLDARREKDPSRA